MQHCPGRITLRELRLIPKLTVGQTVHVGSVERPLSKQDNRLGLRDLRRGEVVVNR